MPINQRAPLKKPSQKPVGELTGRELIGEFKNVMAVFEQGHRNWCILNEVLSRAEFE